MGHGRMRIRKAFRKDLRNTFRKGSRKQLVDGDTIFFGGAGLPQQNKQKTEGIVNTTVRTALRQVLRVRTDTHLYTY